MLVSKRFHLMVMSRLFQTKHHTLALAPPGGILFIVVFSMWCLQPNDRQLVRGPLRVMTLTMLSG